MIFGVLNAENIWHQ